jgi:L-threonylcarbamoyladenylate synthase
VAVRVPAHPMAQQLLTAFGGGIAAPSANRYGRISPTRAEHVREEFGAEVRVVLDGGDCKLGLESTIVACLDGQVQLLRPGSVTLSQLEQVVGAVQTERSAHTAARTGQWRRALCASHAAVGGRQRPTGTAGGAAG